MMSPSAGLPSASIQVEGSVKECLFLLLNLLSTQSHTIPFVYSEKVVKAKDLS